MEPGVEYVGMNPAVASIEGVLALLTVLGGGYLLWKVFIQPMREWSEIERKTLDMMDGPEWDDKPTEDDKKESKDV